VHPQSTTRPAFAHPLPAECAGRRAGASTRHP
jgi:hypothetical protein